MQTEYTQTAGIQPKVREKFRALFLLRSAHEQPRQALKSAHANKKSIDHAAADALFAVVQHGVLPARYGALRLVEINFGAVCAR